MLQSTDTAVRDATLADLEALHAIENAAFGGDRITRRQFRHLLTHARARTLVVCDAEGTVRGYAMLLFRRGSRVARLYSIAVDSASRHAGLGQRLVVSAEQAARSAGCAEMRLEVRIDNVPSLALFTALGYRSRAVQEDYYEDHATAVRMFRPLMENRSTEWKP